MKKKIIRLEGWKVVQTLSLIIHGEKKKKKKKIRARHDLYC